MGMQPIAITGLCRDLMIRHFQPGQVETPDLRRFLWSEGDATGILIESIHRWRGNLVEKRPAIVVKRNAYRNLRLGVGDRVGLNERGMEQFATYWLGSHTLFCLHGSGAGADILATEVQRELTQFGPAIVRSLGLLKWAVTEVGAISEIEEAKESFVVPVTVGWCYEERWTLNLESLKLRKIPLTVLLDGAVLARTR